MPPVREKVNTRSRKERERNFVSPGRGRGIRRRPNQANRTPQADPPTNRPPNRGNAARRTPTQPATVTVADPMSESADLSEGPDEVEASSNAGESNVFSLPTVNDISLNSMNDEFDSPPFNISDYQPANHIDVCGGSGGI